MSPWLTRRFVIAVMFMFATLSIAADVADRPVSPNRPDTWLGVWKSIGNSLDDYASRFAGDGNAKELIAAARKSLEGLDDTWRNHDDKMDTVSLMGMTQEASILQWASHQPKEKALEVLAVTSKDLQTKLKHCQQHAKKMGSSVALEVVTKNAQGEQPLWEVFCVLEGPHKYLNEKGHRLDKVSSPATGDVPVGEVVIWATKDGNTTKEETFTIGLGKDKQKIELAVP